MMHNLNKQRCYLAGAIDRVADRGNSWRDNITPLLSNFGVIVLNPLKKPTYFGAEDDVTAAYKRQLKQDQNYEELSKVMRIIRSIDLRMVDISDFLIVNLDLDTHPCGTLEEIFWANRQKKPILIHMVQGKRHAPDWLFGTIPHHFIFDTWQDMHSYLIKIDHMDQREPIERWCFLNI